MSALSNHTAHLDAALAEPASAANDYALGLQLCRAGILSLTRLQLALQRGDRPGALEAIDDLHSLDTEVERLVVALPASLDDPRQGHIARSLREAKMAVAFEKLALASGISGPGLSSRPAFPQSDASREDETADPVTDWPPVESRAARFARIYGPRAAVLLVITGTILAMLWLQA